MRDSRVADVVVVVDSGCGPGSSVQFKARGGAIGSDGRFRVSSGGAKPLSFRGRFTSARRVSGVFRGNDRRVSGCDTENRAFSGTAGPRPYPAGARRGSTGQGAALEFFVPSHRLTVGSLDRATLARRFETTVAADCAGGGAARIEQEISLSRPLLIGRTGSFRGTQSLGSSTTVEVGGQLAADGTAAGTLRVIVTGPFGRCDTGAVSWSARPRVATMGA